METENIHMLGTQETVTGLTCCQLQHVQLARLEDDSVRLQYPQVVPLGVQSMQELHTHTGTSRTIVRPQPVLFEIEVAPHAGGPAQLFSTITFTIAKQGDVGRYS